jgi:serine O-acetyltransferase
MRKQKSLWGLIISDLNRYRVTDRRSYAAMLIICPGASAGIIYRIGHWMYCYKGRFSLLVKLGYLIYILVKRMSEIVNGISIQPQATIGEGLYVGHGGSVHIGGKAVLGDNCNISQEVTIGVAGRGDKRGTPKLGDRVLVGAGAKILGAIEIGDDVAVGANAVVTKSLPDRAVAIGIPAYVISYEGSFEFVSYINMENDPTREESLRLRGPL